MRRGESKRKKKYILKHLTSSCWNGVWEGTFRTSLIPKDLLLESNSVIEE